MKNINPKLLLSFFLFGFLLPCIRAQPSLQNITFKYNHFDQIENVPFDKITERIEYIPLETTEECLLEALQDVVITENYLIVNSKNNVFMFTREGKFLRRIGLQGKGPQEYIYVFNILFNKRDQTIYLIDMKKVLIFDLNGKFIHSFDHAMYMKKFRYLTDNIIVADRMIEATHQNPPYCLYFFDDKGNELKKIQSRCKLEEQKGDPFMFDLIGGINYGNDKLYFVEQYGDTIYLIRKDMNLEPVISLDYGKYKFTQEMNYNWNKYNSTGKDYIHLVKFAIFKNMMLSWLRYNSKDYYTITYLNEDKTTLSLIKENGFQNGGFILPGTEYPIKPFFGKGFLFATIWPFEDHLKKMFIENITSEEGKKRIRNREETDNPVLVVGYYQ